MTTIRAAMLAVAIALPAGAQQLVHRSFLPTVPFTETDATTAATPLPDFSPNSFTPRFVPMGGPAFPLGDLTFDNTTGLIWETDGFMFQATPTARHAPLAPALPPTPTGLPPLTGLAIDGAGGVLYATDGLTLFTVFAFPPFPPAAPPTPLAFPAVAPPYTGLEFEAVVGLLYACDAGGYVYYFTPGGAPSGPNPVFPPPGPVPPATDLAGRPGLYPSMYVQFLGLGVIDYVTGALQPAPMTGIPPGTEGGLAWHSHPASLPGACPCFVPAFGPMTATVTASSIVPSPSFGFSLSGGPPSSSVLFGLDFGLVPPLPIGGGCTFRLPYPPGFLVTLPTNAAGGAYLPLPIPLILPLVGLTVVAQWAADCPSSPSTFVLSDALHAVMLLP